MKAVTEPHLNLSKFLTLWSILPIKSPKKQNFGTKLTIKSKILTNSKIGLRYGLQNLSKNDSVKFQSKSSKIEACQTFLVKLIWFKNDNIETYTNLLMSLTLKGHNSKVTLNFLILQKAYERAWKVLQNKISNVYIWDSLAYLFLECPNFELICRLFGAK